MAGLSITEAVPLGPKTHLILFIILEILLYFERGYIAGALSLLKSEVGSDSVSENEGLLSTALVLGIVVGSPLFATLGRKSPEHTMIAIISGLALYAVSCLMIYFFGKQLSYVLVFLRFLTGVGQAGFCTLSPAIVNQSAPVHQASTYMGIFFMSLYFGIASGTVAGGQMGSWSRAINLYLALAITLVPLIGLLTLWRKRFLVPSTESMGEEVSVSKMELFRMVSQRRTFWWVAIGYGGFMFFAGGVAFWGPHVIENMYGVSTERASLLFGMCTVISGILGTALGGKFMDMINQKYADSNKPRAKHLSPDSLRAHLSVRISALMALGAIPFIVAAPFAPTDIFFFALMAPAEFLLFATTAPSNIALMMAVPEAARSQALGMGVALAHLIGDVPSPWIIGKIYRSYQDPKQGGFVTLQVCAAVVGVCALVWFAGSRVARSEGRRLYRENNAVVK